MVTLLQIHLSLSTQVSGCGNIEAQLSLLIIGGSYLQFNIPVDAEVRVEHALTDMVLILSLRVDLAFQVRGVVERDTLEVPLTLFVEVTQLAHLLVGINQHTVLVIERHGSQARFKHPVVFDTCL